MIELTLVPTLLIVLLWPIGVGLCMYAYFAARKKGNKLESWLWFGLWCILITFIEWWVWAIDALI